MEQEGVQHTIEHVNAFQMQAHDKAILARDPMALDHTRRIPRELDDLLNLPRHRPDPHQRRYWIAEERWIEIEPDPANQAGLFETLHTLADGGA
jgi:hypothetical protein